MRETQPLQIKKHIFMICAIYFLAQFMLLIVSGRWWDDYTLFDMPTPVINKLSIDMGVPLNAVYQNFANMLPEGMYRIVVFFCYLGGSIEYYFLLQRVLQISGKRPITGRIA